ncbi:MULTISPECIES: hypothetical protein [unclassified Myxococcus]|jgi:hypothetical protein|uniref:hypothetical protein n=1 Tax=unclassified Myxococcus TaxID=2648731 RepID=UPI001CC04E46|nr:MULTISPECIES: hypothetical protein [unclassified Myxococcus]MBZ4395031.1 hypothetical protein [Myxococcus sp. AS-1-15]MBZ4406816.1 hypothetical protein [Myxococcus sp. XM-1-1-1]
MLELQERFIEALLESVPEPWERVEVHYERYAWGGDTSEIYVANGFLHEQRSDVDLTLEALEALRTLQEHTPARQREAWTWLLFRLDAEGRYHFDYRYGVPPLVAQEMAAQ